MDILDFFPKRWKPRKEQIDALKWFEKNYDKHNVFCLAIPVAGGKSAVSTTISAFCAAKERKSAILTPTVILQDQYEKDFPELPNVKGADQFICKDDSSSKCGEFDPEDRCFNCPHTIAKMRAKVEPESLMNYWTYYAQQAFEHRDVVIVDEAHNTLDYFTNLRTVEFSQKKWEFPDNMESLGDAIEFLERVSVRLNVEIKEEVDKRLEIAEEKQALEQRIKENPVVDEEDEKRLSGVTSRLKAQTRLVNGLKIQQEKVYNCSQDMKRDRRLYHFQLEQRANDLYLILKPLSSVSVFTSFWPKKDNLKIVFLSATIDKNDVKELGLYEDYSVGLFECESPIPVNRRPIIGWGKVNMSFKKREEEVPKLAQVLLELADTHHKYKGMVHVTYGLAEELKPFLEHDERFWFHSKKNKRSQYAKFLAHDKPVVLMASGMSEGVDLSGSKGRWQVITNIPRPSWGDLWVQAKAGKYKDWYDRQAVLELQQMSGRICRSVDDYGVTYIVDSRFKQFYKKNERFFREWFKEALIFKL